tara:strand:+ start:227 stop:742 length:516 start_codon:yes stop_codon:yes gene_type:complete
MKVEKTTIKAEAGFSDNRQHRFYMKKIWDAKKKSALVLMLSAGDCNGLTMDYSSLFTVNNLVKLDYGSVEIMNLFSSIDTTIKSSALTDKDNMSKNDDLIIQKAKSSDSIIIAWGRAGNTNKIVQEREKQVIELLKPFMSKTFILCDSSGRKGFHVLAPQCRNLWNLQPFS